MRSPILAVPRVLKMVFFLNTKVRTSFHKEACIRAKAFLSTYDHPENRIDSLVNSELLMQSDMNKHILRTIVEAVLFCGKQGIPIRGHRDDATANPTANRGNFFALLEMIANHDLVLKSHLEQGSTINDIPQRQLKMTLSVSLPHVSEK